ncbi:MAG: NAD(P)H-dependent oxidoreductase subunit E [Actinomycetes bacterium]
MPLSDSCRETAAHLVARYPVARSALLPLLHLVQSEEGYVSEEGIAFCAEMVGLTKAEVGAVATFYTMFKREPVGDYLLSVCTTTTCKFAGADEIFASFKQALGGRTTDPDTKVSIEHAECLGICDAAPVVQVNYEMFGPLTGAEADDLLAACRKGQPPVSPWSGETPPTFAEIERDLSGANDAFGHHLVEAARQQAAYENPPAYRSGETDIPVTAAGGDPRGVGGALFREAGGAALAGGVAVREAGDLDVAGAPAATLETDGVPEHPADAGTSDTDTDGAEAVAAAEEAAADTPGPDADDASDPRPGDATDATEEA